MAYKYLKTKTKKIQVLIPEGDYREARKACEEFFGDRYFSQFAREAIKRYTEYFKSYEDATSTKRFYCDLDAKVHQALLEYCEGKDVQVGEVASLLLSEKLYEIGVIEDEYFIPEMINLI